jgi:hypothetical protein
LSIVGLWEMIVLGGVWGKRDGLVYQLLVGYGWWRFSWSGFVHVDGHRVHCGFFFHDASCFGVYID